jgi:hypothetical protein
MTYGTGLACWTVLRHGISAASRGRVLPVRLCDSTYLSVLTADYIQAHDVIPDGSVRGEEQWPLK